MSSLSVAERGNPPPRRKSCIACMRSKRRCDTNRPSCLRCRQRGIGCSYQPASASDRGASAVATPTAGISQIMPRFSGSSLSLSPLLDPSLAVDWRETGISWASIDQSLFESGIPEPELELVAPPHSTSIPRSCSPRDGLNLEKVDHVNGSLGDNLGSLLILSNVNCDFDGGFKNTLTSDDIVPRPKSELFPPSTSSLAARKAVVRERLQYALDAIKLSPSQMVRENQTPWCHASLYQARMPRSMQDAYAYCGLYMNRNDTNTVAILHIIESRAEELIATPQPKKHLDSLARCHALLLYHIICVFDGDIAARAFAERTAASLESAAMALLSHITFDKPDTDPAPSKLPLHPLNAARESWREWVIMESARRTFLIALFFLHTYRVLRGEALTQCASQLCICHSWTLSAYLWQAQDAFEFAVAWNEKHHFVVTSLNITRVLEQAQSDDIESFGKILITAFMGIEEAKGWMATKGGCL